MELVSAVLQSFTSSPSKTDTSLRWTVGAGPERVHLRGTWLQQQPNLVPRALRSGNAEGPGNEVGNNHKICSYTCHKLPHLKGTGGEGGISNILSPPLLFCSQVRGQSPLFQCKPKYKPFMWKLVLFKICKKLIFMWRRPRAQSLPAQPTSIQKAQSTNLCAPHESLKCVCHVW